MVFAGEGRVASLVRMSVNPRLQCETRRMRQRAAKKH